VDSVPKNSLSYNTTFNGVSREFDLPAKSANMRPLSGWVLVVHGGSLQILGPSENYPGRVFLREFMFLAGCKRGRDSGAQAGKCVGDRCSKTDLSGCTSRLDAMTSFRRRSEYHVPRRYMLNDLSEFGGVSKWFEPGIVAKSKQPHASLVACAIKPQDGTM
jgi:hypothetical protein